MALPETKTRKPRATKAPDPVTVNSLAMKLSLSQRVELIKALKTSITADTSKLTAQAKEAEELTKGI